MDIFCIVLKMFRLKVFGVGFWRDLLRRVEELSGDLCLVGSYARGDASPLSDVDFVVFSEGESKFKRTEIFCLNDKMVTLFSVRAADLIMAESLDFYSVNNPFEARLICGEGKVLNKLRSGLRGKSIDWMPLSG
jgi:predicted nucleotidyltransferase